MEPHDRCRRQMRFIRRFVKDFGPFQQSQNELLTSEGLQKLPDSIAPRIPPGQVKGIFQMGWMQCGDLSSAFWICEFGYLVLGFGTWDLGLGILDLRIWNAACGILGLEFGNLELGN